jgi:predicted outer membrane repeat protein
MHSSSSRLFSALIALVLGALLLPLPTAAQTTIYADDDASGANDGSQSDPYATLQAALSDAASTSGAVEIRVAGGVYYPDEGSGVSDGTVDTSFVLSGDLTVKGGYTSDFSSRDPDANVTVLSGDVDQDDTTNEDGVVTDTADVSGANSYHVVEAKTLPTASTLEGLTITAGQANDEDPGFSEDTNQGGGILTDKSDLILRNVEIVGNYALEGGGGIHMPDPFDAEAGSLAVEKSIFRENTAQNGGAVSHVGGPLTMTNVTVQSNVANEGGGVHSISDKQPFLSNVTFTGNKAIETGDGSTSGNGGGLYSSSLAPDKNLVLRSVTFENNTTEYTGCCDPQGSVGGGANLTVGAPTLIDVTFRGNSVSETDAGGLFLSVLGTGGILRNSLFEDNQASTPEGDATDANAGALQLQVGSRLRRGDLTVANTTFRNNSAKTDGGAVSAQGSVAFEGVLFEGNNAGKAGGGLYASGSGWTLRDAVFRDNVSSGAGIGTLVGGAGLAASHVYNPDGNVSGRLRNVRFVSNDSGRDGGGMVVNEGIYELQNVDFIDNVTGGNFGGKGAALLNDGATVQLVNAEVRANNGPGGIIEAGGDAQNTGTNRLVNVLLADNGTETAGSGVVLNGTDGTTTLNNVAVANNGGTGLVNSNTMTVHNSIVYDNDGPSDIDEINNDAESTIDVQNTLVRGGLSGQHVRNDGTINDNGGNITGDPMFAAPSNGDYHLQSGSPAVDAGNDSLIPDDSLDLDADGDSSEAVPYDLDQRSRTEGAVDLGPYERGGAAPQFTASLSSGDSDAGLPERFGADLTFQTLSTATEVTVTYDGSASTEGLGLPGEQGLAVTSLWNIEFNPEPASSEIDATVCFDIEDLSFPVVDRSALNVYARSGPSATDWQERTPTELRPSAENPEQICATGQSSFSQFAVTAEESELPVELVAFEAQVHEEAVRLSWQTASETNNAGFAIQHKAPDEATWTKRGFVESSAPGGTSTTVQSYRFTAENLSVGTHRFCLQQVDLDGTAHRSETVTVEIGLNEPVRLTAPAPNPVRNRATLSFAVKEAQETTIRLYNVLGQEVATLYRDTPAPEESQTVNLSASDLSSGVYFLRLQAGEHTRTQRMTVVR